ncbi:MAG: pilus assembly protein TadB [Desulfuromonas sp.]|nr:MAG: pilus assembly protein TadB [Desulfuromonas sp.]
MEMVNLLILISVFLFTSSIIGWVYLVWTESKFAEKARVKRRLLYISAGKKHGAEKLSLYKKRTLSEVGAWERFVLSIPRISTLDRLLLNSGVTMSATLFVLLTISLGVLGYLVGSLWLPSQPSALALGIMLMVIPYMFLKIAESRTMGKFEEQLPEGLDLLARAVRSGHSLSSAMEMVASEMDHPIGPEFRATVDEINMGLSLQEALANLTGRMKSRDLRFFAIAILIQRESGGNIAEIFDNLSRIIRERIQFRRQVKALTAEGKLSGIILVLLPIVMFLYIYLINYDYISLLWRDPLGLYMIGLAVILQIVGVIFIRRIVKIEI